MRRGAGAGIVTLAVAGLVAGLATGEARAQSVEAGERLYQENCAQCHGADGAGIVGVYPPLDGDPFVTAAEELPVQVVLQGRLLMPSFGNLLTDREVADVVSYIRTAWENEADPVGTDRVAELRSRYARQEGDEAPVRLADGWRAEGERLFADNCAACHQPQGEGVTPIFPNLAGNPVVTTQVKESLVRILLDGRGGMPTFARGLSHEELAYVLSYIRSAWGNDAEPVGPEIVDAVARSEE